nr:hypothetical protein CFP56_69175 [Quercus suber]
MSCRSSQTSWERLLGITTFSDSMPWSVDLRCLGIIVELAVFQGYRIVRRDLELEYPVGLRERRIFFLVAISFVDDGRSLARRGGVDAPRLCKSYALDSSQVLLVYLSRAPDHVSSARAGSIGPNHGDGRTASTMWSDEYRS